MDSIQAGHIAEFRQLVKLPVTQQDCKPQNRGYAFAMDHRLQFEILPQPSNTTCGPTCLHAVYRYLGDELPLPQVIEETQALQEGATACRGCGFGIDAYWLTWAALFIDWRGGKSVFGNW